MPTTETMSHSGRPLTPPQPRTEPPLDQGNPRTSDSQNKRLSPFRKRQLTRSRSDDGAYSPDDSSVGEDTPPYKTIKTILDSKSSAIPTSPQDHPLNLTTSGVNEYTATSLSGTATSLSGSATYTQLRPSVIIRAAHDALLEESGAPYHQFQQYDRQSPSLGRREILTAVDDSSSVDEHFRRSLGDRYFDQGASGGAEESPSPRLLSVTEEEHNSVDGSVDDHFARSLGQSKWNEIKAQSTSAGPSSVDDHFAKALGDQWADIKAQQEALGDQWAELKARQENVNPRLISPS